MSTRDRREAHTPEADRFIKSDEVVNWKHIGFFSGVAYNNRLGDSNSSRQHDGLVNSVALTEAERHEVPEEHTTDFVCGFYNGYHESVRHITPEVIAQQHRDGHNEFGTWAGNILTLNSEYSEAWHQGDSRRVKDECQRKVGKLGMVELYDSDGHILRIFR